MLPPDPDRSKAASGFFRKASLSFTMRFAGLALQFLGAIMVARLLGAESYGAYTYASTWAVFIGMIMPLGLSGLSVREVPAYLERRQLGLLNGYFLTLAATVALSAAVMAGVLSWLERAGLLVLAPGWKLALALAVIHALVLATSNMLNAFQRILTSQFLETILRQSIYLGLIGAAAWLGFGLSSRIAFELSILSALPVLAVMGAILLRMWRQNGSSGIRPRFAFRFWFAGAAPILMTVLANRLQLDLDVMMVGAMLGDREVGIYRAAARGAMLVSIANMVALQLVGPMLSRALAADDSAGAQQLLSKAAAVSFLTGMPIVLALGAGAPLYLGLYGAGFPEASLSLRLLMLGQAAIVLAGADSILLIMLRRERLVLLVTAGGVVANFALNLSLIGPFGIEGAAVASLISMIATRLTMVLWILRTTGFDPTVRPTLHRFLRKGKR